MKELSRNSYSLLITPTEIRAFSAIAGIDITYSIPADQFVRGRPKKFFGVPGQLPRRKERRRKSFEEERV